MGDGHVAVAGVVQLVDGSVDGAVQPEALLPQHDRAVLAGPVGDGVVVARDRDRPVAGSGEHALGGPPRQPLTAHRVDARARAVPSPGGTP